MRGLDKNCLHVLSHTKQQRRTNKLKVKIKMDFKEVCVCLDLICLTHNRTKWPTFVKIKGGQFLGQLDDYQFLKKGPVSWSSLHPQNHPAIK